MRNSIKSTNSYRRAVMAAALFSGLLLNPQSNAQPAEDAVPQSVFVPASATASGRNPFFPDSTMGAPIVAKTTPKHDESFAVTLNGLSGPPRRTAIINGRTFEAGEQAEVRNEAGGKATVKCEKISDDSAIVLVNNERRTLRLRSSM